MSKRFISRGFCRWQHPEHGNRLPPGPYQTTDFPLRSAGPVPRIPLVSWDFTLVGCVDQPRRWTWDEFHMLPREAITIDMHCATRWSKLDTGWEGVSVDTLLDGVSHHGKYVVAYCDGGSTTNLPISAVTGGKAWIVDSYDGVPLVPEHGGPARLLLSHLYFWKSAKWIRGLALVEQDRPGFWETPDCHNEEDPWREPRYHSN